MIFLIKSRNKIFSGRFFMQYKKWIATQQEAQNGKRRQFLFSLPKSVIAFAVSVCVCACVSLFSRLVSVGIVLGMLTRYGPFCCLAFANYRTIARYKQSVSFFSFLGRTVVPVCYECIFRSIHSSLTESALHRYEQHSKLADLLHQKSFRFSTPRTKRIALFLCPLS